MSELELLFLVLALIYVWESTVWLRRDFVAFAAFFGSRSKPVHPAALLGNQTGGFILANPLPPLGWLFVAGQSPVSLSPEGAYSYVAQCVNPGWRPAQTAKFVRFDEMKKIEAAEKKVRINGETFLTTASPALARQWAADLGALARLPRDKREAAIRQRIETSLDTEEIESVVAKYREHAGRLRLAANVLVVYLFVAVPAWAWNFGVSRDWPFMLAGLLALTMTIALLFHRAYKELQPDAREERFTHSFMIALSPAAAARAHDTLARPLLQQFHPLAVAKVLLAPPEFVEFGRSLLRELRHPCLPICPTTEPAPVETERYSRAALLEAVERFLMRNELDPAELDRAPAPVDASSRAYCPRCRAQFVSETGTCADCGGIPLARLPR